MENKNYSFVSFLPDAQKKIPKKIKKSKKYHYGFISSKNRLEKDVKERNKNYRSILLCSCPMRNRKFHKNSKKFKKKKKEKKYDYGSFQAKIGRKRMRNMENKNYRFISFLPDAQKKIPKKIKKSKKYYCGFISSKN